MKFDVDVGGFQEFGNAADELSALFTNYITKLQSINFIDDTDFLRSILVSLKQITNLSNIFGHFKETILATSTIQVPKSIQDTRVILENVMGEVNCAMQYIQYFVDPSSCPVSLPDAKLSEKEQNVIKTAVSTIENWNQLCDQGVRIAMSNDSDVQFIQNANSLIKSNALTLKDATAVLKGKISVYTTTKKNCPC
jgi:hypothetical protein